MAPPPPPSSAPSSTPAGSTEQSAPWTPQSILASLPAHSAPPATPTSSPVPFFHLLTRLKTTKREGWRRFGISHGESISDHMYRMSILTLLAPPSLRASLDIDRCTRLALVHDMAELLVGDITPVDGVAKPEKSRREASTMDYLCLELLGSVDGGVQGRELRAAWQEYEDGESEESKFVHDVDKMELMLQMVEYERASVDGSLQPGECLPSVSGGVHVNGAAAQAEHKSLPLDLGEFTWVATRIQCAEVRAWAAEVLAQRRHFWAVRGVECKGTDVMAD